LKKDLTKILFLYTELAGYMVASMNFLAKNYSVEIKIIHWQINEVAPFEFNFQENIQVHIKPEAIKKGLEEAIDFSPNLVYISGWIDKQYLQAAKIFKQQGIPVLLGIDNPWRGGIKQHLGSLLSSLYIKPYATHLWCSGIRQYEFARKLGFDSKNILLGLYSADVELFKNDLQANRRQPKTLLYVGRFLDWKGVRELYDAFVELKEEDPNNAWKLLMYGRGPIKAFLKPTAYITIKDFIQPEQLKKILHNVGAFCLPSYEEHWGVVVHEAVASGCPVLVSEGVEAGTLFVKNNYNGYIFKPRNKQAIKDSLQSLMNCSENELNLMRKRSVKLSTQVTPEFWAATLMSVIN